jgi:hypothetical protein
MAVINNLDNSASKIAKGKESLVVMLPEQLARIPFEIFRVFLRAKADLHESHKEKLN